MNYEGYEEYLLSLEPTTAELEIMYQNYNKLEEEYQALLVKGEINYV